MAWAYEKTGDTARQRQACRQLVQRAEAVGAADDAEELVAARAVLRASV
jgi:hypothetical protein